MNTPLALQCYNLLLGLYPASFRATFGSEMGEVFSLGLDEAAQRGGWTLITFWLHEILTLVPAALAEHSRAWQQRRRDPAYRAQIDLLAARWIARVVSFLLCSLLLEGFGAFDRPFDSPAIVLQTIGYSGLVLAWRWERLGGMVMLLSGLLSLILIASLVLLAVPGSLLIGLLSGMAWGGPFLIFGWLFITIGWRGRHRRPA